MLLVDCMGHYVNLAASVFFNLHIVSRSPTKLSTTSGALMILQSLANLPCLVNLALRVQTLFWNVDISERIWKWCALYGVIQGCPNSVLEDHCCAEFSSNLPQYTCLEVSSIRSWLAVQVCLIGVGAKFYRTVGPIGAGLDSPGLMLVCMWRSVISLWLFSPVIYRCISIN